VPIYRDPVTGTIIEGLDPNQVPTFARKATTPYVARTPAVTRRPRNPLLALRRATGVQKDKITGTVLGRTILSPKAFPFLYKPGGLLYKPPAE
jgi:hypothetical protein